MLRSTWPCWEISTEPLNTDCDVMLTSMASTAEMASGEMALELGEAPVEGATLPAEGATLPTDKAALGVAIGDEAGAQAETIRRTPQIARSPPRCRIGRSL